MNLRTIRNSQVYLAMCNAASIKVTGLSVRELKRQIASLYYERSGLSAKPEKMAEMVPQKTTRKLNQ